MKFIIFIMLVSLSFCGCNKTFNDIDEYEKYIKSDEYPYLRTIIKNGVKISVRYLPSDALMINEYRHTSEKKESILRDTSLTEIEKQKKLAEIKKKLEEQKQNYDQSIYFQLIIGYEDEQKDIVYEQMKNGFDNYSEWLQKLLFALKEYVYLRTDKIDEIPMDIYQMENTYGLTKYRKILLAFPSEFNGQKIINRENKNLTFVIKEFGLKTGRLKLDFQVPINDNVSYNFVSTNV